MTEKGQFNKGERKRGKVMHVYFFVKLGFYVINAHVVSLSNYIYSRKCTVSLFLCLMRTNVEQILFITYL